MNRYIRAVVTSIGDSKAAERAIQDLRLLIERYTMNRYGKRDEHEYSMLFSDDSLLDVRFTQSDIDEIKVEIFFLLLRYSKYSVLFAKCIKVLFDAELWEPIRRCIYAYMDEDDTVCELIFAITNPSKQWELDQRNHEVFADVLKNGGEQSRNVVLEHLAYFQNRP